MSLSKRRVPKEKIQQLAHARIEILWEQALKKAGIRPELAREQMLSARKIAQRARIKTPRHINRRICKACGTILIPGNTCRVRVRHNRARHVVVTCSRCGHIKRYYSSSYRSQA